MSGHGYFPLFVDLSGKNVLVVGAGKIASRRIRTLRGFTEHITVVAPEIAPELEDGSVALRRRPFAPEDLEGADLVVSAADDAALNASVAALCRERGIPVNVSTDSARCDVLVPGVARKGALVAGITAGGEDHSAARRLTEAVRKLLESFQ